MHSNTNEPIAKTDAQQAYNFGDALHAATSKGLTLNDVLYSVADSRPANFMEAAKVTREITREFVAQ